MFSNTLKLGLSNGLVTVCLFFLLLLTLALLVHLTVYRHTERFRQLASKIPGPKWFPFIGSAYVFGTDPRDILKNVSIMTEKFNVISGHWIGPVYYIALQKPEDVEVILSSNTMVDKTIANEMMKTGIGEGLIAASGNIWRRHRRCINPTFNNHVMERYVDVFYSKMKVFAEVLDPHSDTPELDIVPFVQNCVFDILCETMMSTKSNLQNSAGKQNKYIDNVVTAITTIHTRMFKPWLYVDFFFNRTTIGKNYNYSVIYLTDFIKQAIERRKTELKIKKRSKKVEQDEENSDRKKGGPFLDYLLEIEEEGIFSEEEVLDETRNNMFAGFDSVAFGISFVIYVLSKRFDIQEKIVEEILEVFGTLDDKPFSLKDLNSLKYLDRVTKEVLRLFSPVPYLARQCTEETKLPSGYTLPKGSGVIVMLFRLHRDSKFYPAPDVFDPDNFLPERSATRPAYSFCPFSAGPRNCIGHRFSMLEIKAAVVCLLRRYWLTPVDMTLDLANKLNLFTTNGVKVGFKKRTVDRPQIQNYERLSGEILTNLKSYNMKFKQSYA